MTQDDSDQDMERDRMGINRRSVLRGAAASGIGLAGVTGFTGSVAAGGHNENSRGGKPCHKEDWNGCDEGDTYVKFEFVIETDDDENITDCYFEEETDTGLIAVTYWEDKDENVGSADPGAPEDAECEPVYVEWESDAEDGLFFATEGLAFGGDDCDPVEDPVGGSYTSELENNGEETAAISNLQFCVTEADITQIPSDTYIGYEDRPDTGDFDYNDFGMRADIEEIYVDGNPTSIEMSFEAEVKLANDAHLIHIERTGLDGVNYDYTVDRSGSGYAVGPDATAPDTYTDQTGTLDVVLFDTPSKNQKDTGEIDDVVDISLTINSGNVSPPTSSLRPDVGANNPLFEVYDPYMDNESEGETITLLTVRENIDKSESDWDNDADVPNILVVPDPGFEHPGEANTITEMYPDFDAYYADANDDPDDTDHDLEVDPAFEDWFNP